MGESMTKEIRRFQKGQIVFFENEYADCMYSIESGRIGIVKNFGRPSEVTIVSLNKDEYFGEMGVIESQPRSATAVALEDETKLWRITPSNFYLYISEYPGRVINILHSMSKRIHVAEDNYSFACKAISEYMDLSAKRRPKGEDLLNRIHALANKGRTIKENEEKEKEKEDFFNRR